MGPVLDDLLRPGLSVVFCGTAVATASADQGHYYSGPGNKFWQLLHEAGFTPGRLRPEDDSKLPTYGVGITDLVKDIAQSHDRGLDFGETARAAAHIMAASPSWVAFNGQTAGRAAAAQLGLPARRTFGLANNRGASEPVGCLSCRAVAGPTRPCPTPRSSSGGATCTSDALPPPTDRCAFVSRARSSRARPSAACGPADMASSPMRREVVASHAATRGLPPRIGVWPDSVQAWMAAAHSPAPQAFPASAACQEPFSREDIGPGGHKGHPT